MSIQSILIVLVCLVLVAFLFGFRITINPFKVTFTDWLLFIAYTLIGIGIGIIKEDIHRKSYQEGLKKGSEITFEAFKSELLGEKEVNDK